jgi:uncharacterized repeat protein (TIGR01451 family)
VTHTTDATAVAGGTAKFAINVVNSGKAPLTQVVVTAAYDPSLVPQEASPGHTADDDLRLSWTFPTLAPGETKQLDVVCLCESAAQRVCGVVTVASKEGATDEAEACLQVDSPRTELTVAVFDLKDPVNVGKELTYEVRVTNRGSAVEKQLQVSVSMPAGMTLIPLGTSGPGNIRATEVTGQTFRFDPVAEILAGETLTFRVRLRADQAGDKLLQVSVTSAGLDKPVAAEQSTKVNP